MFSLQAIEDYGIEKGIEVLRAEPMSKHTTFKIGGPADLLVKPQKEEEICDLIRLLKQQQIPYLIIGNGSDLLVSDAGFRGVVMKLDRNFSEMRMDGEDAIVVTAGVSLAQACYFAYQNGLTGFEFAWGIPGNVGGALYMNAGAYGGEMKDIVTSCRHIALDHGCRIEEYAKDQLDFSYRHSVYSDNGFPILSAKIQLKKGEKKAIKEQMDLLMSRRKTKQPLEYPSAGSTFKRPKGNYASALIEQCGLKGLTVGGAQVSEKHSGFIINRQDATFSDVCQLIEQVKEEVFRQTGYRLECEVKIIR